MKNIKLFFLHGYLVNSFFERGIWIVYLLSLNYTMVEVGILQTILSVTMVFAEVPAGILTDMKGKKWGMILGCLFTIAYMVLFTIGSSYFLLVMGHIMYGIGLSFLSGTDQAYLYDCLLKEKKSELYTKYYGRYGALTAMSLSLAMIIGGKLQLISWSAIFIAGIIYHVVAIVVTLFLEEIVIKEEAATNKSKDDTNSLRTFISGVKLLLQEKKQIIFLIVSLSLFFAGMSVFYMYNQTLFTEAGISASTVSIMFGVLGILQAIASLYAHYFENIKGGNNILMMLYIVILGIVSLLFLNNVTIFIAVFVVTSILYVIIEPIASNILNTQIISEYRTSILSVLGLLVALFMAILFPLIGYLADLIGLKTAMMVMTIPTIIFCMISLKKFYVLKKEGADTSV